jgi:hypothetical protein
MPTTTTIKSHLQTLIKNSPALKSLPKEAREMRARLMLSSDEATMKKFIKVLEDEQKEIKKADAEASKQVAAIMAEVKQLEKEANLEIRKQDEALARQKEESQAEELLKKLDEIQ